MAYAAKLDMIARFGASEIAGLENDCGKGEAAVKASLSDAAAEIDGYIGLIYKLPLPIGRKFEQLVILSCDIARYRLWEGKINDENDTVYVRYRRAVKILEDIAAGKIVLLDDAGQAPEASDYSGSVMARSSRKKIFTNRLLDRMNYGDG